MARPLPVNLLMAGTGAVLLVSGIGGESIGKVLQGEFGDIKGTRQAALEGAEQGQAQSAQMLSSSTFAPSPASLSTGGGSTSILSAAKSQLGTPYRWGGEQERNGFDCSGLTQWSYEQAGIHIPRTAQEQYNAMRHSAIPAPGCLAFFGGSSSSVSHVGIVIAPGVMIDATHTGAFVEYSHFTPVIGAMWGGDRLIGYGCI